MSGPSHVHARKHFRTEMSSHFVDRRRLFRPNGGMARKLSCVCLLMTLLSCGDDGAAVVPPDADHGLSEFTVSNSDGSGDAHSLTIRCTDLISELPVTLTTDGEHAHALQLSVEELQSILAGMTVELRFTEGHEHFFSITKPTDVCTGF